MNKKTVVISCIFSGLLLYGCPPPKDKISAEQGECVASNVQVEVNDKKMNVSWENNCVNTIAGYSIYISDSPNSNDEPFNSTPFDGDTNPDDGVENFPVENLENGKKYYVSVKILNADETNSAKSEEIIAVCGARVEVELSVRYKTDKDGYSFENNEYVRADNENNDLYFYSKNGIDYISSPHNLDGFLRQNKLAKLSYKGDFKELRTKIDTYAKNSTKDKLAVSKNDWILVTTSDKKSALIKVIGFSGAGGDRKIKLFIAYSSLANELIF